MSRAFRAHEAAFCNPNPPIQAGAMASKNDVANDEVYTPGFVNQVELTSDQLFKYADELAPPPARAVEPRVTHDWWKFWVGNRIIVHNEYGSDISVIVHRFKQISQLQELAIKAGVDAKGGGLESTFKWALSAGHAQGKVVESSKTTALDLGGGADGGYVSAFINNTDYKDIVCINNYVKPRWMLHITRGPLLN